jgi:hypothetical protein
MIARKVECICAPRSQCVKQGSRWIRLITHALSCPVTSEQGTTDEELDDGPAEQLEG